MKYLAVHIMHPTVLIVDLEFAQDLLGMIAENRYKMEGESTGWDMVGPKTQFVAQGDDELPRMAFVEGGQFGAEDRSHDS